MDTKLRALAWKQPFGSLMLLGKIETRRKPTSVRGQVLIYTSLKGYTTRDVYDICGERWLADLTFIHHATDPTHDLDGYAIGIGDLVDCRRMERKDEKKCFVSFDPNKWCWIFDNVKRIKPFRYEIYSPDKRKMVSAGSQGWGFVPDSLMDKIIYL